jgi:acetyltransferase-like isoleucine patch superfamily enzyme
MTDKSLRLPKSERELLDSLLNLIKDLRQSMKSEFNRHVSIQDLLSDRWETARFYGFGEGSSCYNNVLILGDVRVGKNTWIGPNVILDGSGGLEIGDFCSISAGTQIYSHHTVQWSNTLGVAEISRKPTRIGSGVYIGPNAIVQMGVHIGDRAIIGAMAFVNRDVPPGARCYGIPARVSSASK